MGDGSDTPLSAEFTLADVYFPEGREQMVRSVRVDFRKWDTGSATANNFSVTVSALGRFDQDGKGDSATQSWSEASASASVNGTDDSETFGFGDQGYGKGFRLEVSAIRGAAIQAIHVTTMPRDATPRP